MIIKSGEFDLRGYEIVRTQFFASAEKLSVSFSMRGIRFSSACVRAFGGTEYVELRLHPFAHSIAVLPCSIHRKNNMRWAGIDANRIRVYTISAKAYLDTLFELLGWDMEKRYRLRGELVNAGGGVIALFDAREPEIFTTRYEMSMPWATGRGFGDDYYSFMEPRTRSGSIEAVSEYDSEPELRPTTREDAARKIRLLLENMERNAGDSDDTANLLNQQG